MVSLCALRPDSREHGFVCDEGGMETSDEMLAAIMGASKAYEGYSLHQFQVWKEIRDGTNHAFDVEVRIADEGQTQGRYGVRVTRDDGIVATGNPSDTLQGALYILSMAPMST